MQGYINLNGTKVLITLNIEDGQIILTVPKNTDLTNWYHSVYIKSA